MPICTATCEIEPFVSQVTPQLEDPSSIELFQQQIQEYLIRFREAICADVTCLSGAEVSGLANLSLSEVSLGITNVDGKAIFQKVISLGTLPNAASVSTAHNITGLFEVVKLRGWANFTTFAIELPFVQIGTSGIQMIRNGANIVVDTGVVDRSAFTGYALIQYTKV